MQESPIRALFPTQKSPVYPQELGKDAVEPILRFHKSIPEYAVTPLQCLPELAGHLGVKQIYVKDESFRFGLNAFKALGATWALSAILGKKLGIPQSDLSFSFFKQPSVRKMIQDMVFITATDGNHGRGLAWAARQLGCSAEVLMPAGSIDIRVENIKKQGGRVRVTDTNYDDTVRIAAQLAREKGWHLVQDTALEGYETIPRWIAQGYTTMAAEVLDQIRHEDLEIPTHLFLQAGVGSMAASVLGFYANILKDHCPRTFIVEPDQADCMYRSAMAGNGQPRSVKGELNTMMAGLACGEPNPWAWQILRDCSKGFFSCPDDVAALGMIQAARPVGKDPSIISGESGAVGLGLVCKLMQDTGLSRLKEKTGLNRKSVVLCFSTEGNTDPDNYAAILNT